MINDVFLHRLIQSVHKWYDELYCPSEAYHKHALSYASSLDKIKKFHVQILLAHYDKERFVNCKDLYEERVKFLTEVQQIVDTMKGVY